MVSKEGFVKIMCSTAELRLIAVGFCFVFVWAFYGGRMNTFNVGKLNLI
jgi:hypothetical protein